MIIRVDHVALASDDVFAHGAVLERLGYRCRFREMAQPNLPTKRAFATGLRATHDRAMYESPVGLPIELVDHGPVTDADPYLRPIIENPPEWAVRASSAPHDPSAGWMSAELPALGAPAYVAAGGGGPFAFQQIALHVSNVPASTTFWQQLGFVPGGPASDGTMHLTLRSVVGGGSCTIHLVPVAEGREYQLTDRGFNCLALVSTSIRGERESLKRVGVETCDPEHVVAHGRDLEVCFLKGPSGEIVELVSVAPQGVSEK